MTTLSAPPALVRDLLSERFFADLCAGKSYSFHRSFLNAVDLWEQTLKRAPTVEDFTPDAMLAFCQAMLDRSYRKPSMRNYRTRLTALWRHAHAMGLVDSTPLKRDVRFIPRPTHGRGRKRLKALPAAEAGSVRHYFETVYRPQNMLGCAKCSIDECRATFWWLHAHYKRDITLAEQTDLLASDHFEWMIAQGKSPVRLNGHRRWWFAVWRHAATRGLVPVYPMVRPIRVDAPHPDAWTLAEMKRIVAAANEWWRAILLTDYWTLLRRRALFELPTKCFNLADAVLDAPASVIKKRRGRRYRLGADAVEAVRTIYDPARPCLFDRSCNSKRIDREFKALLKRAEVAPSPRPTLNLFHKLRRTSATHAAIAGGIRAAADLMGHSETYVTKLYIDTSLLPEQDATRLLPSLTEATP